MAEISLEILESAYRLEFIPKRLSVDELNIVPPSVRTANQILDVIDTSRGLGLTVEQICHRVDLSENTVKIYCRWLRDKGLLEWQSEGHGSKLTYFSIREESNATST
jgi:hypothetical protein